MELALPSKAVQEKKKLIKFSKLCTPYLKLEVVSSRRSILSLPPMFQIQYKYIPITLPIDGTASVSSTHTTAGLCGETYCSGLVRLGVSLGGHAAKITRGGWSGGCQQGVGRS